MINRFSSSFTHQSQKFRWKNEKVRKLADTFLKCSHKEVHSQMLFNARFKTGPTALVINTADTDILIITLCNMPKVFQGMKSWMEVGLTSNKDTAWLNVNKINQSLGYRIFCILPSYHTFTGCNFAVSLLHNVKVNALKKLKKIVMAIKVLSDLVEKEEAIKK